MKKILVFTLLCCTFILQSFAQDRKVEVLEVLYKQKNYRSIVRKTKKLINKKGYEDNELVHLFKAVALAQLSENPSYLKFHPDALKNSTDAYENYYELDKQHNFIQKESCLLQDLKDLYTKAKSVSIKSDAFAFLMEEDTTPKVITERKRVIVVKNKEGKKVDYPTDFKATEVDTVCTELYLSEEEKMIDYAKKFLGVPYIYGGTGDGGFDCSGYTQYILGRYGYNISRSARYQYTDAEPIKISEAKKGDLVFFSKSRSKSNITHVGIVISAEGEELTMIHASSSRGIMVTNVETNTYWKPKLVAAGRPQKNSEL